MWDLLNKLKPTISLFFNDKKVILVYPLIKGHRNYDTVPLYQRERIVWFRQTQTASRLGTWPRFMKH